MRAQFHVDLIALLITFFLSFNSGTTDHIPKVPKERRRALKR